MVKNYKLFSQKKYKKKIQKISSRELTIISPCLRKSIAINFYLCWRYMLRYKSAATAVIKCIKCYKKDSKNVPLIWLVICYGATSFSRNVILSNRRLAEMQFCRIVVLPKKNCRKSFDRIVTWPNRRISETS